MMWTSLLMWLPVNDLVMPELVSESQRNSRPHDGHLACGILKQVQDDLIKKLQISNHNLI